MEGCDFCGIVAGDQSAHVIYRDENTIAFLDTEPAIMGHTLVTPTSHQPTLFTPEKDLTGPVFETVDLVARCLKSVLEPDGFSIFHTSGDIVGNVSHAHVHLLPRYEDDTVTLSLRRQPLVDAEAKRLTDRLRLQLEILESDDPEKASGKTDYLCTCQVNRLSAR